MLPTYDNANKLVFIPPMRMNNREHELQTACVTWFRLAFPKMRGQLFSIPNGAFMHASVARKMKREGMMAGVADVFLMEPSGGKHGLWIELKVGRNKMSAHQERFRKVSLSRGYEHKVCRSLDEFMKIIKNYLGIELR